MELNCWHCPEKYSKLIEDKRECVSDCFSNDLYIYEFKNNCYINCPPESISPENISYYFPEDIIKNINKEKKYYCEANCIEEYPFEKVSTQECVNECTINEIKLKLCIKKFSKYNDENESKEESKKVEDILLENIENDFTSEEYSTSDIEKGQDVSVVENKFTITLTTTENQKNNNDSNITTIDLEECEILLRNHYKLREDQKIFIKRVDVIQEGMKIPKIEYDVYCKLTDTNLIKLNLSICQNVKTNLLIPVIINENIDILNSSSGYYNDICYTSTSDKGTDIILNDRKNEFITNNKTLCQDGCVFSEYDYQTQKAKCSCEIKEASSSLDDMLVNVTKLYDNFLNIKKFMNFDILVCYKKLFRKEGILNNIEFYILLTILLIQLFCIIIFYKKQYKNIQEKIDDIIFGINHWDLVLSEKKEKRIKKFKKVNISNKKKKNKYKKEQNNNIITMKEDKDKNKNNNNIINIPSSLRNISLNKKKNNDNNPPIKRSKSIKIKLNNQNNIQSNIFNNKKNKDKNKKEGNTIIQNRENKSNQILVEELNKGQQLEKTKQIMEFSNTELNELSYGLALKHDNRTYISYTISLYRAKHVIIFTFFYSNDYNSKIVKINLFLLGFAIYYAVNALFFTDGTMHKIYEDEGKFKIIYQLPQIFYSSIISIFLNTILKLLALSESDIISFKQDKNKENVNERAIKLKDKLKIKFVVFFVLGIILSLFFWYYLAMFGAIYKNTQIHLIKDTLISFALSLVYPFFVNLLPGILRIPALSNKKKKREILYNLSKLLQII